MAVVLGTSYPLLDAFWTVLWVFGFVLWIWLVVVVFSDIFRSRDMSGWSKALWTIAIVVLPLLGVLLYLIVRGGKMQERSAAEAQEQDAAMRDYIREVAGNGASSPADQLSKLADLHSRGVISDEEFQAEKAKLLA